MPIHEGLKNCSFMSAHACIGLVRSTSPSRYELWFDLHSPDNDCQSLYFPYPVDYKKFIWINIINRWINSINFLLKCIVNIINKTVLIFVKLIFMFSYSLHLIDLECFCLNIFFHNKTYIYCSLIFLEDW